MARRRSAGRPPVRTRSSCRCPESRRRAAESISRVTERGGLPARIAHTHNGSQIGRYPSARGGLSTLAVAVRFTTPMRTPQFQSCRHTRYRWRLTAAAGRILRSSQSEGRSWTAVCRTLASGSRRRTGRVLARSVQDRWDRAVLPVRERGSFGSRVRRCCAVVAGVRVRVRGRADRR